MDDIHSSTLDGLQQIWVGLMVNLMMTTILK
jgi:hypothetical protein